MQRNLSAFSQAILDAAKMADLEVSSEDIHIERTKAIQHGHFACNIAMLLAGKLGKNPREVAEKMVKNLQKNSLFEKIEVAGPGFINLWVSNRFYGDELQAMVSDLNAYLKETLGEPKKTMVIDYSHPNIAKPMGVHHLLTTIIGDSLKRIYKRTGWKVIADSFIGDMGTQFGKIIHAIKKWGDMEEIERDPINALLKLYVQFHFEADKDVDLDEEARAEYKRFEDGDPESRELWKKIKQWSLAEIQPVYDKLGISFDAMNGESFYEDKMAPILEEGRKKGVIVDGERGSWIIPPDNPEGTPVIIKKSDGATLYVTRDLARIQYWEKTWHPDLMVNVVDTAQEFHFRQLFFAADKLGLTTAHNVHVSFGRMQFKDGSMSTRKGNVLMLSAVLDEAEQRALALVMEKADTLDGDEQKKLAHRMGIGAVKYSILSQSRTTNLTFDWDKMLALEGNSAPYLMYTFARAKSLLRKAEVALKEVFTFNFIPSSDDEIELVTQLLMYPDTIRRSADEFKPNHLCTHLYALAQAFNHFYNAHSILQAENEALKKSHLLLVATVVRIMEDGFYLLGIEAPERM